MKRYEMNKKGFSLVEMVIVVALVSMLTVVISAFLSQSIKSYRIKRQSIDLEEKASHVMREFERNTRAADEIIKADRNELIFYRFFDLSSSSPIQVRYFIDGNQFKIGLTNPVGVEPNIIYPPNNEKVDLIVGDLSSAENLFKYFDQDNKELNGNFEIKAIKMIRLSISLDKNKSLPPAPITQTTEVSLRNMKENL